MDDGHGHLGGSFRFMNYSASLRYPGNDIGS